MSTQYFTFSGTLKWAKVYKPDPKYDNFTVDLYMDEESWDRFNKTGLSLSPREDMDGKYIRFRRPNKKLIKNEVAEFGPPEVIYVQGFNPQDYGGGHPLIGNGSKGEISIVVYDTIKGKGHRLNRVTVTDLIPYNRPSEDIQKPLGGDIPFTKQTILDPATVAAINDEKKAPATKKRPF